MSAGGILVSDTKLERKVDVGRLCELYEQTWSDLSTYRDQIRENENIRNRIWDGQILTGEGAGRKFGPKASPWEGAFDTRNFLIDDMISSDAELLVRSLRLGNLEAIPTSGEDVSRAKMASEFMRFLILSKMDEFLGEAKLAANYYLEKGIVIVGVFWESRVARELEELSIEQLLPAVEAQSAEEAQQKLADPSIDEEVTSMLQEGFKLSKSAAKEALSELRVVGVTVIPVDSQVVNRPIVRALELGRDVIVPLNTADLQSAPIIFQRQFLTPYRLREYVLVEGWNKRWADEVIEKSLDRRESERADEQLDSKGLVQYDHKDRHTVEIIRCYRRLSGPNGVPGIYETIFSDDVKDSYGYHGLRSDRLRNRYPFWAIKRESPTRLLHDSRGYPEKGADEQRQLKVMDDSWLDNASQRMSPPLQHRAGRTPPEVGPGAQWPVFTPGEVGYGDVPNFDPATPAAIAEVENRLRGYFGFSTTPDRELENANKKQGMVDTWLDGWQQTGRMIWRQYKAHGSEVEKFRVLGSTPYVIEEFSKGDPDEEYDFYFSFQVLSQDPKVQKEKLEGLASLVPLDRNGIFNYDEILKLGVELADPTWIPRVIKPREQAINEQHEDVRKHFMSIWAGMDVDIPSQGINVEFWQQALQSWAQGTEEIPAVDVQKRLNEDQAFAARVQKLQQQLTQVAAQRTNAEEYGILGTRAGNF